MQININNLNGQYLFKKKVIERISNDFLKNILLNVTIHLRQLILDLSLKI